MPKGPSGQKRKADVIGNAVLVMKIARHWCSMGKARMDAGEARS